MIICGDFGGVWDERGRRRSGDPMDWLRTFARTTLLFIRNKTWKTCWQRIREIRPHVIHLMRGQIFDLQGYSFFTMGGARSHDIETVS